MVTGARTGRRFFRSLLVVMVVAVVAVVPAAAQAPDVEWTRQFGTPATDQALGVAVGSDGTVYVAGFTGGTLPGQSSAGGTDAFVRAYDASGNLLWTHQFGTPATDQALGVAVGSDGTVYVAGLTAGTLPGQSSAGGEDAFVRAYDASGNLLWTHQFGTPADDSASGVAVAPDGTVHVAGSTTGTFPGQSSAGGFDAFVRAYDASGNLLWTRQFGTPATDVASGVAVAPDGTVHVAGSTGGTLPGQSSAGDADAFVRAYDASGNLLWTRQFGTPAFDSASGVAVGPDGTVHVGGRTGGTIPGQSSAGGFDAFVRAYDASGNLLWTRQFGTTATDVASGVAVGPDGTVHVAGSLGTFPSQSIAGMPAAPETPTQLAPQPGGIVAFVRAYDAAGTILWTRQFGTPATDRAFGVAVGPDGAVHVAGRTGGTIPGQSSAGGTDAFVRKYAGPIRPTVGLVDPTQGRWHLRNSLGEVTSFFYGNPGDIPFMGDWNCNGIATPGLYRQSDGFVYLRNTNTQGAADITFFFGNPGDEPIIGDFNDDGCDTVSIYRPSTQTFHIITQLGEDGGGLGAAEFSYVFGNPGDKPFTGDFDGNGITTVGLHRETTGFVYYRNSHTQGNADNQFFFGNPADRFVTGDWNGDGIDSPAVFRPANTTFFFRHTNTQGPADQQFVFGQPDWLPVAGHYGLD